MKNNPIPGRGSLLPCSCCCSWWCHRLRGWDKNTSATGSIWALSASEHGWSFWGRRSCSALPPRSTAVSSRQPRLPVPSCPSETSTHAWAPRKVWLTFSPLQGGGEAFREGNRRWPQACAGLLEPSWLTPCWQPALAARQRAQIGHWPICRRAGGNSRLSSQPSGQRLLLTSVHNLLDFRLTLTMELPHAKASDR